MQSWEATTEIIYGLWKKRKKQLTSAERWNQSALKPHLVSNGKNIKDYYPQRHKGHEHLPHGVQAKFRGPFLWETERVFVKIWSFLSCAVEAEHCDRLTSDIYSKKIFISRPAPNLLRCWFYWWKVGKCWWRPVYLYCMLLLRSQLQYIIARLQHLESPRCTAAAAAIMVIALAWSDFTVKEDVGTTWTACFRRPLVIEVMAWKMI